MLQTDVMTELAQVARTGMVFFEEAELLSGDPTVRALYRRMAEHKRRVTAALVARLPGGTKALPFQGTLVCALRPVYADMLAKIGRTRGFAHARLLAELEARLLHHFDHATAHLEQYESRHWLRSFLPTAQALLAELTALGKVTDAAPASSTGTISGSDRVGFGRQVA